MKFYDFKRQDHGSYRELSDSFVPMDHRCRDADRWNADLSVQDSNNYRIFKWDQRGDRIANRSPSHVRASPTEEYYWFVAPQKGIYVVRHPDSDTSASPGNASFLALDKPCELLIPTSAAYAFQVPRAEVDNYVRPKKELRTLLNLECGLGRIAQNMLMSVHAEQANLSELEFNAVCDRVTEIICLMLTGDPSPQRNHLVEIAEAVRRYIRENTGQGEIRLSEVARALGWSPRQLRLALNETGTTFRDMRQQETLRAARDMLHNPLFSELSISEIAAKNGLSPSWFSVAFKNRYGETPREFRQRRLEEISFA